MQQWNYTRKIHKFISMSCCLSSWVDLLPLVWGYLYTCRMEFVTKRSMSLLFPSLSGSISHLFEALNTPDSQFSLQWLGDNLQYICIFCVYSFSEIVLSFFPLICSIINFHKLQDDPSVLHTKAIFIVTQIRNSKSQRRDPF